MSGESYELRCLTPMLIATAGGHSRGMIMTSKPNDALEKRDLHIGGLGIGASGALAAVADPMFDEAQSWLERVREAVRDADDYIHANPWAALAVVAVAGVAAGCLLSRRS